MHTMLLNAVEYFLFREKQSPVLIDWLCTLNKCLLADILLLNLLKSINEYFILTDFIPRINLQLFLCNLDNFFYIVHVRIEISFRLSINI